MRSFLIAIASLAAASFSAAQDGRWTLVQSVGDVKVEEPGLSQIAVKPSARLNEGATLTTGPNGRAILTDGRSSITVQANSRVELPSADDENVTSIRQDFGKAIFKVQKKPQAHFEVQTPYMAAVVKGTTFEVTVDALGASVDVEEGLVDVGANESGERALVAGGQRIRVLRSGRFDGGRPAELGRDRQTVAALNLIAVEIAPEAEPAQSQDREFASLHPKFDRPDSRDRHDFAFDRDRDDGLSGAPPGAGVAPDNGGTAVRPPDPVRLPAAPVPSGGETSGPVGQRDDDDDDRSFDRTRWAAYLEKLKRAYEDWKTRHDDDDRDDDDRDDGRNRDDDDRDDRDDDDHDDDD